MIKLLILQTTLIGLLTSQAVTEMSPADELKMFKREMKTKIISRTNEKLY